MECLVVKGVIQSYSVELFASKVRLKCQDHESLKPL